jgi:diketogulonate reductase-like aldo/keto reductase
MNQESKVSKLAICNIDKEELKELLDFCKIKPFGLRLPLKENVDEELAKICEENNIRIISGPSTEVSISDSLKKIFEENFGFSNCEWCLRYSTNIVCQTVIRNRGYILKIKV